MAKTEQVEKAQQAKGEKASAERPQTRGSAARKRTNTRKRSVERGRPETRAWGVWSRRRMRWVGVAVVVCVLAAGNWFAHLPTARRAEFGALEPVLEQLGQITADGTDWLGLTGRDAQVPYEKEVSVKRGPLPFGVPRVADARVAPGDIVELKRKGYWVGFSPSLGHPVWAAYAVPVEKLLSGSPPRPPFAVDAEVPGSPAPEVYGRSGYDRGHLAPNSVIATRYGKAAQKETFLMTNIAPQRPALNRGPWRALEQMIADDLSGIGDMLWVVVCAVPSGGRGARLPKGRVSIPAGFAMVISGVHRGKLRAIGVYMPQETAERKAPRYCFRSVRELERLTGLDFFSALPKETQDALEEPEVTRFWPRVALY